MKKPIAVFSFVLLLLNAASVTCSTGYTGSDTCGTCHDEIYKAWKSSRHGKSFEPEKEESGSCRGCHETGGSSGSGTIVNNVGCEACHGPGEAHVSDGGDPAGIISDNSADICGRCHNGNLSGNNKWAQDYKPGIKLKDHTELKLIHIDPDKIPPSGKGIHPSLIYNMWLASGHAGIPVRKTEINGREWKGPVSCTACHNPHNSEHSSQLVIEKEKLCSGCHFQSEVLRGYGAKGIEETRSLHTAIPCYSCHMTEKNHLMKVLRPDNPDLEEDRLDSCSDCHDIKDREMRTHQIQDMESWYNETMEPVQADLKELDKLLEKKPDLLTPEQKEMLSDVKANLAIITDDGSKGVHNLEYALEIMSLAKRHLKKIKKAVQ